MNDIQWLNDVANYIYATKFFKKFGDKQIKVYRSMMPEDKAGYALEDGKEKYIMIAFDITETDRLVAILAHELVHIAIGASYGHNAKFKHYAKELGLTEPFAEIPKEIPLGLADLVEEVILNFGDYPVESSYQLKYNAVFSSGGKTELKCRNCGLSVHVANNSLTGVEDKSCTNCLLGVFHR